MITTFFKGFLLVGILMWYSIAILTVINDYFRMEFNTYIKRQPLPPAAVVTENPTAAIPGLPAHSHDNTIPINMMKNDNGANKAVDFFQAYSQTPLQCDSSERSSAVGLAAVDADSALPEFGGDGDCSSSSSHACKRKTDNRNGKRSTVQKGY